MSYQYSVVVDFLFIVTPIAGVCNCSMFCCTLLYVHSSIEIILMGKRELVSLLNLSSWCLMMVEPALPRGATGLSAVCDCSISYSYSLNIVFFKAPVPWGMQPCHDL